MVVMQTRGSSKLTKTRRKKLIVNLCQSLASLKTPHEVAEALSDLLTPKEFETIGKRLQIAEYLLEGKEYSVIRGELKVGFSTIARVNTWLNISGIGFQTIMSRKPKKESKVENLDEKYDPYSWHNTKRRYSLYFWPQLLLDELFKQAGKREKEKMERVFAKVEEKAQRFTGEENKALYAQFFSYFEDKNQKQKSRT